MLLPDDIVDATVPCMKQMVEAFEETQSSILGSEVVEGAAISELRVPGLHAGCEEPAAAGSEGHGGEAEADGGTVAERDHRALHPDAPDLRDDGDDHSRVRAASCS